MHLAFLRSSWRFRLGLAFSDELLLDRLDPELELPLPLLLDELLDPLRERLDELRKQKASLRRFIQTKLEQ